MGSIFKALIDIPVSFLHSIWRAEHAHIVVALWIFFAFLLWLLFIFILGRFCALNRLEEE